MRCRSDATGSAVIHAKLPETTTDPDDSAEPAPASGHAIIEAARQRLQSERQACEARLQQVDADLRNLEAERDRLTDIVEPDPLARLRLLAGMSDELRTALHGILGYVQLFRLRGGLDPTQTEWVEAMLGAGTQLLAKFHCMAGLTDIEADPDAWLVNEDTLAAQIEACPALPRQAAPDPQTPRLSAPQSPPPLRVLIAEDIAMNRDIARSFLRAAGHAVAVAETGRQAVAAAETADFDVILMDVRMPDMDGLEATRRIRALPGARGRVPIIALTAQAFSDKVEACRTAGMTGHLAKPFRYDTLNNAILAAAAEAAARHEPDRSGQPPALHARPLDRERQHPAESIRIAALPRDTRAQPNAADPAWIDIESPWNSGASANSPEKSAPAGAYILDTQFRVKLTAVGFNRGRQLVAGATRSCAPPGNRNQYEFHWLLYTDPAPQGQYREAHAYTTTCDLWRWSGAVWQSIAVPGAHFSPEEMYQQGWRYCGPCVEKTAIVEVD
jgi:CheY-like chemotaxis protein